MDNGRHVRWRKVGMNIFKTLKRGNVREEEYFSASLGIVLEAVPELTSFLMREILSVEIENYEVALEDTFSDGRVDIAIKSLPGLIYIENKLTADLVENQLERYYKHSRTISDQAKIILLSRDLIEDESIDKYTDRYIFWSELYALIESFYKSRSCEIKSNREEKVFLLEQLLGFLKEENMSNERVSWEYVNGIRSFLNLMSMIQSVLKELNREECIGLIGKPSFGTSYAGFYINDQDFWVGVFFSDPEKLYFTVESGFREKYKEDVFSELIKTPSNTPSYIYDLQKEYFLAFSKEAQKKAIYEFIRNSLSNLQNLVERKLSR